ncbi:hypothetical protein AAT19DRAFT_8572 [Rhodotorula toruloides]|uniref:Uncharacterized protein n=1 Tax=Rhodotorula toruloides TaxID=5286 RepID=A0A2T0AHM8_RHOTO|nr:hypothetical protein AAT19DRAFT_8572 [Rhodotorula toruloides]
MLWRTHDPVRRFCTATSALKRLLPLCFLLPPLLPRRLKLAPGIEGSPPAARPALAQRTGDSREELFEGAERVFRNSLSSGALYVRSWPLCEWNDDAERVWPKEGRRSSSSCGRATRPRLACCTTSREKANHSPCRPLPRSKTPRLMLMRSTTPGAAHTSTTRS